MLLLPLSEVVHQPASSSDAAASPSRRSSEVVRQPASPSRTAAAAGAGAAAAVARRSVPSDGLTLHEMRNYTYDEVDAELRALGIAFAADTSSLDNKMLIVNKCNCIRKSSSRQT